MKKKYRGIRLDILWTACLSTLPLLIGSDLQKLRCLLFVSYVCFAYLCFLGLRNLNRILVRVVGVFVISFSLFHAAYHLCSGGPLDYNILTSIMDTHFDEALGFLISEFAFKVTLIFVMGSALILLVYRALRGVVLFESWVSFRWIAIGCLLVSTLGFLIVQNGRFPASNFYPIRDVSHLYEYYTEVFVKVQSYRNLDYQFDGPSHARKSITTVLAIGEALRKDKMGIYSPELDTTPRLEQFISNNPDHFLVFADAIASACYTRVSVPSLLSVSPTVEFHEITKHPSIIRIAETAGLPVSIISNQKKSGMNDSFIAAYFEDASRRNYLSRSEFSYDERLVKELKAELDETQSMESMFILRLAGSHWPYAKTYPGETGHYSSEENVNDYLNSVRYNDSVMRQLVDLVMSVDYPVVMVYLSDHGEYLDDFGDGKFGHGFRRFITRFETDIPFFIICNDRFLAEYPNEHSRMKSHRSKKISLDNLSHTLLGLNGLFDSSYRAEYDLSSEKFQETTRYLVDRKNKILKFEDIQFEGSASQ